MKESSYQYNESDLNQLLRELQVNPPKEIDVESMGGYDSIVAKYMLARAGLLHRALELAISADNSIENKQVVSSSLLIRALFETVSVFGYMYYKMINFNKIKDIKEFDTSITNILYGTRDGTTDYVSVNILSMINKIDKEYPNYRSTYDRLSEYSHPNFTGASLLYGSPQKDAIVKYDAMSSNHIINKNENINDLCLCINRLKYFILQTEKIIEEFVDIVNELK
ncbi:MAG: hypothetical protein DRG78_08665 [Epsilonproteobacteria bacterium]|nr:MAG: hypothetical protein DRG78_08665 [Campylobacterota bacterium]